MRKLTGYIGALIVVFALMGSILAGYALNVNGESTVINEYEKVTDVSGLYTHSQEPSYIEYNPASNYIGYNVEQSDTFTINNNSSLNRGVSYKLYKGTAPNCAWNNNEYLSGAFYVNGAVVPYSTAGDQMGVSAYFTVIGDTVEAYVWQPDGTSATNEIHINGGRYWSANFTIAYSAGTITFILNDVGVTLSSVCNWLLMPNNNGDYVPILNGNTGYYQYNDIYHTGGSLPATPVVINEWNGQPVYNLYSITNNISNVWVLVPKTFNYQPTQDKGIDYTVSGRVNNYLMETIGTTITYSYGSINMATLGAPDQFYYNSYGTKQIINGYYLFVSNRSVTGEIDINSYPRYSISVPASQPAHDSIYDSNNPNWYYDGWHNVKLSNVLASFNAPANTKSIKITTDSIYGQYFSSPNVTIDKNLVWFSYLPNLLKDYGAVPSLNSEMSKKDYLIFDVANNLATVYTYDGTARYSGSPDDIGIFYYTNGTTYKGLYSWRTDANHYTSYNFYDMNDRPAPTINLTATIATPGTLKYADITKGYAIKTTNTDYTVWNNNYQNGTINILFRANDVNQTYHNDLKILDNDIAVDFENNHFYVTLGTDERVDIGTWRNIILNVDLTNGYLSVVPVRTFNSFTNVIMDNTSIVIGELTGGGSTNIIKWAPTSNSLMFNVYSTSVFMNTYGVVMVNPTINITNYFTDLNNFYRMRLFNFSVLGDSITVNGITADVVNNTITIDGQTVQLKEMAITYADGHAYISDSNASIDLGDISDNTISMAGAWYFETELQRGYTSQKMIYNWDWGDFILNNTQFCIMFMGLAVVALIVAKRYCTMAITDYIVLVLSFIIALTVQVVA